jgi:hypothetical protein
LMAVGAGSAGRSSTARRRSTCSKA